MNQAERYIDEVMRLVLATREERERFAADLRAHFEEGIARGQTPVEIIFKLGTPETVAEAFNAERPLEHAGFFRRLAAFFADVSLFVIAVGPSVALLVAMKTAGLPQWVQMVIASLLALAVLGFSLIYFPLLEARFGRTFGKYVMRIRVLEESGHPLRLRQAIIRRLSFYFDLLAIDAIFIFLTDKKQRGLDILAKTIVVREPGERAPLWAWLWGLLGWLAITAFFVAMLSKHL